MNKSLDTNYGCLSESVEKTLVNKLAIIMRTRDFYVYYKWLGIDCPDKDALSSRLRQAITNSKAKRYHGCSEHMNELPPIGT